MLGFSNKIGREKRFVTVVFPLFKDSGASIRSLPSIIKDVNHLQQTAGREA